MRKISRALAATIEKQIVALEQENNYFKSFLDSIGAQGSSSSVSDFVGNASSPTGQIGTQTPIYLAQMNTFIANPSNVGIGILARMIETDDTIMSSVQFKSMMLLSKIGEYQHEDKKIEELVRKALKRLRLPNWRGSMEAQTSDGAYGFSISEILWGVNNELEKVPMRIKTYHPSTLCFEVDPYGDVTEEGVIQFVVQNAQISNPNQYFPYFQYGFQVKNPFQTPDDRLLPYRMPFINNYGLVRIPKNKCIHHISNNMLSFGSPYGKTAVRTAHLAWQLKVFFMKQLGIAGKRQASPFIWATAPHGTNKVRMKNPQNPNATVDMNAIEAVTELLRQRESDDSIVTGPESVGYHVEAIANQTNLDQFLNVIDHLNTYMFRAFLLPSLVMTDGSAGSRALGDKHFQIVDRIAEEDAQRFTDRIIDQLIRPTIIENFGEQDEYGHFAQRPQTIEERERLANIFNSLANSQWMSPTDKTDGDYVRSTLHLPEQEESFYAEKMPNFDPIGDDEDDPEDEVIEGADDGKGAKDKDGAGARSEGRKDEKKKP